MSDDSVDPESTVRGTQTTIPARIRQKIDINDGDTVRWQIIDSETVRLRVVEQRGGTFSGFDGYDGTQKTSVATEHDAWAIGLLRFVRRR